MMSEVHLLRGHTHHITHQTGGDVVHLLLSPHRACGPEGWQTARLPPSLHVACLPYEKMCETHCQPLHYALPQMRGAGWQPAAHAQLPLQQAPPSTHRVQLVELVLCTRLHCLDRDADSCQVSANVVLYGHMDGAARLEQKLNLLCVRAVMMRGMTMAMLALVSTMGSSTAYNVLQGLNLLQGMQTGACSNRFCQRRWLASSAYRPTRAPAAMQILACNSHAPV